MENKPEYYECIKTLNPALFTVGKLYKINNPNNLEDTYNFIDNHGEDNGWSGINYKHFKPVSKWSKDKSSSKHLIRLLRQANYGK